YLEARGVGLPTTGGVVPLVVGAILYDLAVGAREARPDRAMGVRAAGEATSGAVPEGSVGAGGGASVGALVAVNAFGDVRDPETGALLAGARDAPAGRELVDTARHLREGRIVPGFRQTHTTIGVVATDASLN